MVQKKKLDVIGVPLDLGVHVKGSSLGPDTIRSSNLLDKISSSGGEVNDKGNLLVPSSEDIVKQGGSSNNLEAIEKVCLDLKKEEKRTGAASPGNFRGNWSFREL